MEPRASRELKASFSHSHGDRWIAGRCVKLIEESGKIRCSVFLDERNLTPGDLLIAEIHKQISGCDLFFILLTPESKTREWVMIELGAAWFAGKRIIPILHGVAPGDMPVILKDRLAIRLDDFMAATVDRILGSMRKGQSE